MSAGPRTRILIAPRLHGPGGVETHLLNLCPMLAERGAQVTIATRLAHPSTPLVRLRHELPIRLVTTPFAHRADLHRWSTLWAVSAWPLQVRLRSFDILCAFEMTSFLRFLSGFVKPGGIIVGNRVGIPVPADERLPSEIVRLLDGFIVETDLQADAARSAYGLTVPIATIPHLGHAPVNPAPRRLFEDPLRVAFLGRFDRKKGVHRLLDLWPHLDLGPSCLDFYGDGEERPAMLARLAGDGLNNVYIRGGWSGADELSAILARTDLVVLPSTEEGLPLVLLEAMAHGVPFVAFAVGAIPNLAKDNPDVAVVSPDDRELATALERVARAIRNGEVGGQRLAQFHQARFDPDVLAREWADALLCPESYWTRARALPGRPAGERF